MNIVFDRAASFYDQTRALPADAQMWLAQVAREQTALDTGSRVLEIGVGTGRIALPLARENGYRYTGVDLSRDMMAGLRRKAQSVPVGLAQSNAAELPFGDHVFDGVVAVHIFHLIGAWQRAIDEVARVLRVGGVLLHGRSQEKGDSPLRLLKRKLDELSRSRWERQSAGLLAHDDIRSQLEWRFGPPRLCPTPAWSTERSPRQVIDSFTRRIWSSTWLLSDDVVEQAAAAAREWAIARFGSLDEALVEEQQFIWEIYTKQPAR